MRKIHLGRLLPMLALLAAGFVLGRTHAVAGGGTSPDIEVTTYDEVLDVDGTVVVEGDQGFVEFTDTRGQAMKVEVRGWDPLEKKQILGKGSIVRVTGADTLAQKKRFRGHVTLLK